MLLLFSFQKFSELLKTLDGDITKPNPAISKKFDEFSFAESQQKSVSATKPHDEEQCDDGDDVEVEDEETYELEFKHHKRHYYMEKFDMEVVDK